MKHLTERQKQSLSTKFKITEEAINLFRIKGYDNVTIQDICKASNISVGAFYYHFESKKEIVSRCYLELDHMVEKNFKKAKFKNNIDKILFIYSNGCEILENLGFVFVSNVYRNILSDNISYVVNPDRYIISQVKICIDDAFNANELKETMSSTDLSLTLVRACRGIIFDWCLHQGSYCLKETVLKDLDLILDNIKSKDTV